MALISTMLGLTALATPETVPFWLDGTTLVLVELEATVSLPVSSWMPYAVPPPIAAATIATAASRATGPRALALLSGTRGAGAYAGGGGHSGFTGEEAYCWAPWYGFSYSAAGAAEALGHGTELVARP